MSDFKYSPKFTGIFIPKDIWLNDNLNEKEKTLWATIHSLEGNEGCYASNDWFAWHMKCSKPTITRMLSKLHDSQLIFKIGFDGRTNTWVTHFYVAWNIGQGKAQSILNNLTDQNQLFSLIKNDQADQSNLNSDNTIHLDHKIDDKKEVSLFGNSRNSFAKEVIEYCAQVTGVQFKTTTETYIKAINARKKENKELTIEDFKAIINYKWHEWKDTEMQQHCNPETLFRRSKFPKYYASMIHYSSQNITPERAADRTKKKIQSKSFLGHANDMI